MSKEVSNFNLERECFLKSEVSAVNFWYKMQGTYPALFAVARHIFATPVSSCASERVFSAVKRGFTNYRSRMKSEILEDIVVMRSALTHAKRVSLQ